MFINRRLLRDPNPGGSGGVPTLSDLTDPNYTPPTPPSNDPPAGDPPPAEPVAPVEGLDEQGNLLDNYERNADGVPTKKEDTPPANDDDDNSVDDQGIEDSSDFWKAVEDITGIELAIEYPEGVDPLSPEGVALREQTLASSAVDNYDNHLKETHPRAYAFFLHLQNGGTEEDFFEQKAPTLPTRTEFLNNLDVQAETVKNSLILKGVPPTVAQATVDVYLKDNVLSDEAVKIYDQYEHAQKKQIADAELMNSENLRRQKENERALVNTVNEGITKEMNFVIPQAKVKDFTNFVYDNIRQDSGEYYLVQPINKESIKTTLEALYLQYVKGDINSLVERQAKNKAVQRLRLNMEKDSRAKAGGEGAGSSKKNLTLGDI
jgi:hypothetical protein